MQDARLDYRPPAQRGDVLDAVRQGYRLIGLVDGVFYQAPAVTVSEVREASEAGAQLWGAASVGALRACEVPRHIAGVGRVYRAFRDGTLSADDEVGTTFLPESWVVIGHPLVNVREALSLAGIPSQDRAAAIKGLQALPFYERTLEAIYEVVCAAAERESAERVVSLLRSGDADVKRSDAMELVRVVLSALDKGVQDGTSTAS